MKLNPKEKRNEKINLPGGKSGNKRNKIVVKNKYDFVFKQTGCKALFCYKNVWENFAS